MTHRRRSPLLLKNSIFGVASVNSNDRIYTIARCYFASLLNHPSVTFLDLIFTPLSDRTNILDDGNYG